MGASKPVFTCIKTNTEDNVQRWVNKRSDILQSLRKQMIAKTIIFPFCLLQPRTRVRVSAKMFPTVKLNF